MYVADVALLPAAAASFSGWLGVMVPTIILFKLYMPITEKAIQRTRQPSIIVAEAYRGTWVFPAFSTLLLYLGVIVLWGSGIGIVGTCVLVSGIAVSVALVGVGSGYLS